MHKYLTYLILELPSKLKLSTGQRKREALLASFGKQKESSFDFVRIEKYFKRKDRSNAFQVLSDKTCGDLDFDEFFMFVDRTHSKIGQQYLYNKLRVINKSAAIDEENKEAIIQYLLDHETERIAIQQKLGILNHNHAFYIQTLFQEEQLKKPSWYWIYPCLSLAAFSLIILSFLNPLFAIGLLPILPTNTFLHYWNKDKITPYISSIPQLLKLNYVASQLFKNENLKTLNPSLPRALEVINKVKARMSFFRLEANLQGEIEAIAWFFFEIFKITFLLEPIMLYSALEKLNSKRSELEEVFEFVGKVDMLISIASLRKDTPFYCLPTITTINEIRTQDCYHPLVTNCVPNDLELTDKSILLTGSNMAGKTTFIRTVGLNVITAFTLNTCFAKSFQLPVLKLLSAIRISDDLMNDKSYYFEEVLGIKEMLEMSQIEGVHLFLLDELFKGTNTVERVAAGKAVLSKLTKGQNMVMVSTHDIELTELLEDEYNLFHFSELVGSQSIDFDYKLKKGPLKQRNAIKILEVNDYPKELIEEALELAQKMDHNKASS